MPFGSSTPCRISKCFVTFRMSKDGLAAAGNIASMYKHVCHLENPASISDCRLGRSLRKFHVPSTSANQRLARGASHGKNLLGRFHARGLPQLPPFPCHGHTCYPSASQCLRHARQKKSGPVCNPTGTALAPTFIRYQTLCTSTINKHKSLFRLAQFGNRSIVLRQVIDASTHQRPQAMHDSLSLGATSMHKRIQKPKNTQLRGLDALVAFSQGVLQSLRTDIAFYLLHVDDPCVIIRTY